MLLATGRQSGTTLDTVKMILRLLFFAVVLCVASSYKLDFDKSKIDAKNANYEVAQPHDDISELSVGDLNHDNALTSFLRKKRGFGRYVRFPDYEERGPHAPSYPMGYHPHGSGKPFFPPYGKFDPSFNHEEKHNFAHKPQWGHNHGSKHFEGYPHHHGHHFPHHGHGFNQGHGHFHGGSDESCDYDNQNYPEMTTKQAIPNKPPFGVANPPNAVKPFNPQFGIKPPVGFKPQINPPIVVNPPIGVKPTLPPITVTKPSPFLPTSTDIKLSIPSFPPTAGPKTFTSAPEVSATNYDIDIRFGKNN